MIEDDHKDNGFGSGHGWGSHGTEDHWIEVRDYAPFNPCSRLKKFLMKIGWVRA